MRTVRSFLLLCAFALTVAGCAGGPSGWKPAPWVPVASAPARPVMVAPAPAPGIDATVYGSAAPRTLAPMPVQAVSAPGNRGLLVTADAPRFMPAKEWVLRFKQEQGRKIAAKSWRSPDQQREELSKQLAGRVMRW